MELVYSEEKNNSNCYNHTKLHNFNCFFLN